MDALGKKILLVMLAAPVIVGLFLFGPAGTLDYWQAWVWLAVIFVPVIFVIMYFLKRDPAFLERRLKTKEKEAQQDLIVKAGMLVFLIAFLVPGLDRRFGWSEVPSVLVLAADALVLSGYVLVFLTFRENSYAGRTVRVEKGQKVISTGPYAIVRHPMYFGSIILYLATPIALGSYVAFLPFLLYPVVIYFRIMNEEEVLRRELPGYKEYCGKTRYRLIPHIW